MAVLSAQYKVPPAVAARESRQSSAGIRGAPLGAGGSYRHGTVERDCRQELHGSDVSCLRRAAEVRSVATAIRRPAQHGEPKAVAVAFRPRRTADEEPRRFLQEPA